MIKTIYTYYCDNCKKEIKKYDNVFWAEIVNNSNLHIVFNCKEVLIQVKNPFCDKKCFFEWLDNKLKEKWEFVSLF